MAKECIFVGKGVISLGKEKLMIWRQGSGGVQSKHKSESDTDRQTARACSPARAEMYARHPTSPAAGTVVADAAGRRGEGGVEDRGADCMERSESGDRGGDEPHPDGLLAGGPVGGRIQTVLPLNRGLPPFFAASSAHAAGPSGRRPCCCSRRAASSSPSRQS